MELKQKLTLLFEEYLRETHELVIFLDRSYESLKAEEIQATEIIQKLRGGGNLGKSSIDELSITVQLTSMEVEVIEDAIYHRLDQLKNSPDLVRRMVFIYLVALFDAYLGDAFEQALVCRPELLRSSKKSLSYEKILDLDSKDLLIEFLAKKELHELGYQTILEQANYYRSRFNIALADSGVSLDHLSEIRATRNLLVHNKGMVNHTYLDSVKNTKYQLNERIVLSQEYLISSEKSLNAVAKFLYRNLLNKFSS